MRVTLCIFAALLLGALVNGCATRPKVDWNTRIGNYTYDQAELELGVPDKYQKLEDSTVVADWAMRHYSPDFVTYGYGGGYWGHPWGLSPGIGYGYPVGPDYTRWLRLVFGPDGKLKMFRHYDR